MDYLDEDDELRPGRSSACATTPAPSRRAPSAPPAVAEDWADWFDLTRAFVAAYAPEEIEELEEAAPLMNDEMEDDTVLTAADRAYLAAVELLLDAYPEMRLGE